MMGFVSLSSQWGFPATLTIARMDPSATCTYQESSIRPKAKAENGGLGVFRQGSFSWLYKPIKKQQQIPPPTLQEINVLQTKEKAFCQQFTPKSISLLKMLMYIQSKKTAISTTYMWSSIKPDNQRDQTTCIGMLLHLYLSSLFHVPKCTGLFSTTCIATTSTSS